MRRPSPHDLHWPPISAAVGALLGEESSQLIMKQNVSQGLGYGHHGLYVRPESAQPITSIFRLMDLKHSYMCTQFKYVASQISLNDEQENSSSAIVRCMTWSL